DTGEATRSGGAERRQGAGGQRSAERVDKCTPLHASNCAAIRGMTSPRSGRDDRRAFDPVELGELAREVGVPFGLDAALVGSTAATCGSPWIPNCAMKPVITRKNRASS